MHGEGDANDPLVIAAADQLRAQAIEELKRNTMFLLMVPAQIEGREGTTMLFSGNVGLMVEAHQMLMKQLTISAVKDFLKEVGEDPDMTHTDVLGEYMNMKLQKGGGDDSPSEETTDLR